MRRNRVIFSTLFLSLFALNLFADENTDQAWQALTKKDYAKARAFTQKCRDKAKDKGLKQQKDLDDLKSKHAEKCKALTMGVISPKDDKDVSGIEAIEANKELNDLATANFIEAETLLGEGKTKEAKKKYEEIINNYKDAFCWDPKGWYWKVSDVAQDKIDTLGTKYNYKDYKSETLTKKAWDSLKEKDYKGVELYTKKCVRLFERKAVKMHGELSSKPGKRHESENWALNDVATCYFILGEKYLAEGNTEEAKKMYGKAAEFKYAVCWDPQGWHWDVSEVAEDKLETIGTKYDYGNYKDEKLVNNAWESLKEKDYKGVEKYTRKCIHLYEDEARRMQEQLISFPPKGQESVNWALNSVATSYYIRGEMFLAEGKLDEAKQMYAKAKKFTYAYCWDLKGWYFKVVEAAQDKLDIMGTKYDYGDYKTETLIKKAWDSLQNKDYKGVDLYAQKCIHLYEEEAKNMQSNLNSLPAKGNESVNWALNDVAICYYLLGEKFLAQGDVEQAKQMYTKAKEFTYAYCWDPKGWYFVVAEAAQDRFDTIGTKYNYEDYKSETLIKKAWDSLIGKDYKGVELYAGKCIRLFEDIAKNMQASLKSLPPKGSESVNWALNDVATSYYLLGEKFLAGGNIDQAKQSYTKAKEFTYAYCWDPKGWYFKIADVSLDKLDTIGTNYNYEDYKSLTLVKKAWESLQQGDLKGVELYSRKCIYLYESEAKDMNSKLTAFPSNGQEAVNWALNDVAISYYLLGEKFLAGGNIDQAKQSYTKAKEFTYAYCWDPRGWYFKVVDAAQDKLDTAGTRYNYEDYRSETLIRKAWDSLREMDYMGIELYAKKCIYLYENVARQIHSQMDSFPPQGYESANWAVNDVATAYYLLGEKFRSEGRFSEAPAMYVKAKEFTYALCWDPRGWYFKIGEVAQDKLDTIGTPYDYGDYRSVTLTQKAWEALGRSDYRGVELYCQKCIRLYSDKANEMQGQLSDFAQSGFTAYYWALNDVGTCYFILGEAYIKQNNLAKANESYGIVLNRYRYAQCWDPRGWYWQIAKASQEKLNGTR